MNTSFSTSDDKLARFLIKNSLFIKQFETFFIWDNGAHQPMRMHLMEPNIKKILSTSILCCTEDKVSLI